MKASHILVLIFMVFAVVSSAATIPAASPSYADVAAAVASAVTGDAVVIPAGTAYWTKALTVTEKGITIQGAGIGQTIIVDENPARGSSNPATVLRVDWSDTNPTKQFRLTGITIQGGTTNTATTFVGALRIKGSNNLTNNSRWRIDHCAFNRIKGRPGQIRAWCGLVDNCTFDMGTGGGWSVDCRFKAGEYGDRSWANPVLWGTIDAGVYFEHNYVTSISVRAFVDGFAGAKYVMRFNDFVNRAVENHGTESTRRTRSGRAMEVYGNTFTLTTGQAGHAVTFRGGTGLVFSNTLSGNWPGLIKLNYFLSTDSYPPWRQANGTNVRDLNVAGGPFANGTHTGTNNATILVDSTKTWTVDKWQRYSVQNLDQFHFGNGGPERLAGLISANTATTITCVNSITSGSQIRWNTGDRYEIWRVDKALDAPGRGEGDLLSGGSGNIPPTPTTWPNQINRPIYFWANTGNTNAHSGYYPVIAGRDYIMSTPGFPYTPLVDPHPWAGGPSVVSPLQRRTALVR